MANDFFLTESVVGSLVISQTLLICREVQDLPTLGTLIPALLPVTFSSPAETSFFPPEDADYLQQSEGFLL